MVRQNNQVGVFEPFLVFDCADEPGELPVGVSHRVLDSFRERFLLFFFGHSRGEVERVMVGTRRKCR